MFLNTKKGKSRHDKLLLMRIMFTGGGSGGHFYPLIAIAEAIRDRQTQQGNTVEMFYIGPEAFSQSDLEKFDIHFIKCPAGKRRNYFSILNYTDKFKVITGFFVAFVKLLWLYPDVVMSKGSYTSVPVILAAWMLRIPIVIHESDAVPGRANMLAGRFAKYIGIAHDDVASHFKTEKVALVGMPMRKIFFTKIPNPFELIGIPNDKPVILVTGGSLGAKRINDLIIQALDKLLPNFTILHQAGNEKAEKVKEYATSLVKDKDLLANYFVLGHMPQAQMSAAMQAASIVISRAGSTTLFELALLGKPAIVIPIPEDVSRDQRANAYAYARGGGATVLEEKNLSDDILVAEITRIMTVENVYQEMSQAAKSFTVGTAAYTLADTLLSIGIEHES